MTCGRVYMTTALIYIYTAPTPRFLTTRPTRSPTQPTTQHLFRRATTDTASNTEPSRHPPAVQRRVVPATSWTKIRAIPIIIEQGFTTTTTTAVRVAGCTSRTRRVSSADCCSSRSATAVAAEPAGVVAPGRIIVKSQSPRVVLRWAEPAT